MRTVFFDVDTQIDFLYPSGALYVPGAARIVERIALLNRYAAANGFAVISSTDAHTEDDPEFQIWPHHCVAGTVGQQKPGATLLGKRLVVPSAPCELVLEGAQQILLEKQEIDCFSNENLREVLSQFDAERYVIYGVVTEICVQDAAFGLLTTGRRVELVTDAVRALNADAGDRMIAEFAAAGGELTTVARVMGV
jgi:nicotinamidase/pyrazinamidase